MKTRNQKMIQALRIILIVLLLLPWSAACNKARVNLSARKSTTQNLGLTEIDLPKLVVAKNQSREPLQLVVSSSNYHPHIGERVTFYETIENISSNALRVNLRMWSQDAWILESYLEDGRKYVRASPEWTMTNSITNELPLAVTIEDGVSQTLALHEKISHAYHFTFKRAGKFRFVSSWSHSYIRLAEEEQTQFGDVTSEPIVIDVQK
jgi:hypothetical protein